MLTLTQIGRSRYLLHRGLVDAGFPADRSALAVDVLLGPEPPDDSALEPDMLYPGEEEEGPEPEAYHPEPEDEAWVAGLPTPDDRDWLAGLDADEAARYSA
jgi:hypothetical protein